MAQVLACSTCSARKKCCSLTWELSCFLKIPKYDIPLLRRIFRRRTKSYPIHKFEDKNRVLRYRNIIHHSFTASGISTFHMYSQTAVRSRVRALAALLLLETKTLPPPETS